jgi:gliding motility-associated-like protein
MKKILNLLVLLVTTFTYSQNNCPSLGPDQYLPCGVTQTTLNANMLTCNPTTVTANQTTSYSVTQIPFVPQSTVGATPLTMNDDSQQGPFNIGFSFCFFGNTYTQFYIGSNGWISFSPAQPTSFTSLTIPNISMNVPKNCIMGPWQDWNPGIGNGPYIRYQLLGSTPCRRLVVSWNNCPMYSCTTTYGSFQIVIYESTNIIDNIIINKPNCLSWAGGTAVEGIHNLPGTVAFPVPGRNSTVWTATNQTWRWTPSGPPVTPVLTWFQVGNPTPIGTGPSIVVTPPANGAFYTCQPIYPVCNTGFATCVNATSNNSPDTVFVSPSIVNITPTITAPTCISSQTQISVSPNTLTNNILWTGPSIVGGNNTPTINIGSGGLYTVILSVPNTTCMGTATVQVSNTPTLNITSPTNSLCANNYNGSPNSAVLTASGALTYTWSGFNGVNGSSNNSSIILTPTIPFGMGTVTLTGSNGICSSTKTYTLNVIPNPTISVTSASVCQGNSATLNASNASQYVWFPTSYLNTNTGPSVVSNVLSTTIYSVVGNSSGCQSTTQTSTMNVTPIPFITVGPSLNTICSGNGIVLTAYGGTNYTWTPSTFLNTTNGSVVVSTPTNSILYTVVGEQSNCSSSANYNLYVIPTPTVTVTNSVSLCLGESTSLLAGGGDDYLWTPNGNTTPNITVSPTVTSVYNVTVTNQQFCSSTSSVLVIVNPLPSVNAGRDTIYNLDENMVLNGVGTGTLTWVYGNGITCNSCPNTQVFSRLNGCYTLKAENEYGCKNYDDVCLQITSDYNIWIPNAFTPNNDEPNNKFYVYGHGITHLEMFIFDRWGTQIFYSNSMTNGWDGKVKGVICKEDVYVYQIKYVSLDSKHHVVTGHVTLLK